MLLLIDHYDSFSHNLARYLTILGHPPRIVSHDQTDLSALNPDDFSGLVLSPGPGRPEQARTALELVHAWAGRLPMLGICLGHQVIAHAFGAQIVKAPRPMHGYLSAVSHDHQGLFLGVPDPLQVTRYHSLVVDRSTLPADLKITAETVDDQLIMGLSHRTLPIAGVQFHPEALLTESGLTLLENFLQGIKR